MSVQCVCVLSDSPELRMERGIVSNDCGYHGCRRPQSQFGAPIPANRNRLVQKTFFQLCISKEEIVGNVLRQSRRQNTQAAAG